ncbi:FAD:protein FMN transferase [Primorskyibacter sp. 2E233]|uniref:FAD:protein FMN transferase n=1 Tax=Primorskyibacter sp. 2E233 TaxID=3413431 RepID=UPI003BF191F8
MKRRRFLTLSAAFACAPRFAQAASWRGQALGADVSVTLQGPRQEIDAALATIPKTLDQIEGLFSLYRPSSSLSRLNRTGALAAPDLFAALMDHVTTAHDLTGGLFDPTIQPLWQALALGEDPDAARALIGWDRVTHSALGEIRLAPGQQMTLNGIAQGFATDLVKADLLARGFDSALINIGEFAAIGGPFRLGLSDPALGMVGHRVLGDGAIATSSPGSMQLGGQFHILGPQEQSPLWSTVSIEAASATMADALSTAAVFMPVESLRHLKANARLTRITTIDSQGNLRTI